MPHQFTPLLKRHKLAKLPKPLSWLTKAALEDLCVQCGICCASQVSIDKGNVLVPDLHCKYLVEKSDGEHGEMRCSVYKNRHEMARGWCFPLAEAIEKGLFPASCPYVREVKGYVGAQILPDDQYKCIKSQLRKALSTKEKPDWVSDEAWKTFLLDDDEK